MTGALERIRQLPQEEQALALAREAIPILRDLGLEAEQVLLAFGSDQEDVYDRRLQAYLRDHGLQVAILDLKRAFRRLLSH